MKKAVRTRSVKLTPVVVLNQTVEPPSGEALYQDEEGNLWRGKWPHDGKIRSMKCLDGAFRQTPMEALSWFAQNDGKSVDGSGTIAPVITKLIEDRKSRRLAMDSTTEMKIKVSAFAYGRLAEAAKKLGCTVEEAFNEFVNSSDALCEWGNHDFFML